MWRRPECRGQLCVLEAAVVPSAPGASVPERHLLHATSFLFIVFAPLEL